MSTTADDRSALARARVHARRQCRERLGVKLTRNLRGRIVSQLLSGRAEFVQMGNKPLRTIWRVDLNGETVRVVYDERIREVVSLWSEREIS